MPYRMPTKQSDMSGTTHARVTSFKDTVSHYGGAQIQFNFTSERGSTFCLYMNVSSASAVTTFLEAGILKTTKPGEFDVVPLAMQPLLKITLEKGKLKKMERIQ